MLLDASRAWTARSSARAASRSAPGASRPNSSVIRCTRPVTIVADRWCGLVTTLAMISVSAGYGTDGSSTPTMVADAIAEPDRLADAPTDRSSAPSSRSGGSAPRRRPRSGRRRVASSSRPSTGRRPMTSKYEPPTTPARTTRGSPRPTIVKPMVEKSPKAVSVLTRAAKVLDLRDREGGVVGADARARSGGCRSADPRRG